MKRIKPKSHIELNNKGSAIVTVIVGMMFVMALGAALLYAAYTGYMVKITERGDKENFYSASAAMDDIRLGVQNAVTEAIAAAYTDVLENYYDRDASYDPQTDFDNKFIVELSKAEVDGSRLFVGSESISQYLPEAMEKFLSSPEGSETTVFGDGTVTVNTPGDTPTSLSLKAVSVKYVYNGYESDITTDIIIQMPDFFAGSTVTSGINSYAIVANEAIVNNTGGKVDVSGDVFAGNTGISTQGNGNGLTFKDGNVICKGPINVGSSAELNFAAPMNELWVGGIIVGSTGNGTVTLNGKVYVADDLVLNGSASSATLSNTYFGFGSSDTEANKSSSILINGRGSTLDIKGLAKLSLAGVGFINTSSKYSPASGEASAPPIIMGESMSVISDQLAYLVPAECISNYASNPTVFDSANAFIEPEIDVTTTLWEGKTLGDYTDGKCEFKIIRKNLEGAGGQILAYVYMAFKEKKYANEYFKDYFAAYPDKITQYLDTYLELKRLNATDTNTAGSTYSKDGDKWVLESADENVLASGTAARFEGMRSPYTTFVNTAELDKLPAGKTLIFELDGKKVAVVTNDAAYSFAGQEDIDLIISDTNVRISNDFTGIVISGGTITISAGITSSPLNSNILNAKCTDGGTDYTLSQFIGNGAPLNVTTTEKDAWDLDSLVYYENWAKN